MERDYTWIRLQQHGEEEAVDFLRVMMMTDRPLLRDECKYYKKVWKEEDVTNWTDVLRQAKTTEVIPRLPKTA